ncbi:hypothetical protein ACFSHP_15770 [Novosphingobium panipatense]
MIAAKPFTLFKNLDANVGSAGRKGEGDQSSGKSTAEDCKVTRGIVAGKSVHRRAV